MPPRNTSIVERVCKLERNETTVQGPYLKHAAVVRYRGQRCHSHE